MFVRKIRLAYLNQSYDAKRRGIDFLFTYDEWVKWWELNLGSDWYLKRGNKAHQYVMARNGDTGPYTPTNVRCILSGKNVSEAHLGKNKSQDHKSKIGKGNKGKVRSLEARKKISDARKGKKLSEAHKLKISEGGKKRYSKLCSDFTQ